MKKIQSVEEAVQLFEESSIIQSHAQDVGDSKTYNKHYPRKMGCIMYLHEHQQLKALYKLLSHENAHVRQSAAFALLPKYTKECEKVLAEIADGNYGIESFDAKMTLQMWLSGELVIPYQQESKRNKSINKELPLSIKKTKSIEQAHSITEHTFSSQTSPIIARLSKIFEHEPTNAEDIRIEDDGIYVSWLHDKQEIEIRMNTSVDPYTENVEKVYADRVSRLKAFEPIIKMDAYSPSKLGFMQIKMTIPEASAKDDLLKQLKEAIYQIHGEEKSHNTHVCFKAEYEGEMCYFENLWWYFTRAVIKKRRGYERYDFSDESKLDEEMWEMELGAINDIENSESFELIPPSDFQEIWDNTARKHRPHPE